MLENKRCVLALSGGVDSMVLLHQCVALRDAGQIQSLRAIHIHHHYSEQADAWEAHCRDTCEQWQLPFQSRHIEAQAVAGDSLEAFFRRERYRLLLESLDEDEVLLLAHHQDDQAETFLLQALRGAGPYGLSGMHSSDKIMRPLLQTSKADILAYAQKHQLSWVDDESNADTRFSRNFLRHDIMPLITDHWPQAAKTLARAAAHQQEAARLLDDLAEMDWQAVRAEQAYAVNLNALRNLSHARQKHLVRYVLRQRQWPTPPYAILDTLLQQVFQAGPHADVQVAWQRDAHRVVARRYQSVLWFSTGNAISGAWPQDWSTEQPLSFNEHITLHFQELFPNEVAKDLPYLQIQTAAQAKEAHNMPLSSKSLKRYFQQQQIPPCWRAVMPLFFCDGVWLKEARLDAVLAYWFYHS